MTFSLPLHPPGNSLSDCSSPEAVQVSIDDDI